MIKRFEDFLNENKDNNPPITIRQKDNEPFFIRIHFDDKGKVDKIENKWDIKIPDWRGLVVNEIEIKNWISKRPDFYIEEDVNEALNQKIAFYGEIKFELKRYLEKTVWGKVGGVDKRADQLMDIHKKFIEIAMDKLSADEIAKKLFEYEKNILNRK
ncbi:MAG: hypothetical protein ACOC2W_02375 [bacterium]